MARVKRAAVGMLTVAEMMHAAERCRLMATPDRHLDEGVVDGLFMATRLAHGADLPRADKADGGAKKKDAARRLLFKCIGGP